MKLFAGDSAEDRRSIAELAGRIFDDLASPARVREVERSGVGIDRAIWSQLARSGLIGLTIPSAYGGAGLGLAELAILLLQQGRRVAPVPLLPTLVLGALPVAEFGTREQREWLLPAIASGELLMTGALFAPPQLRARPEADGRWRISGSAPAVPIGALAHAALVAACAPDGGVGLFVVALTADEISAQPVATTARQAAAHLTFDDAVGEPLGDPETADSAFPWLRARVHVAASAVQLGVASSALEQAARYVTERVQFGRPLGSFQAVAHQLADARMQVAAIEATLARAVTRLDAGLDPGTSVLVSRWWACEGGERVTYTVQHVHGGLGADLDYPVHRYFLWSRELSQTLGGGAPRLLAELGDDIAARAQGVAVEDLEDAMHGDLEARAWT
jgi:3-oxocholest-4-en-26-oyl-CoA dehydrogenase beta subunit